MAQENPLRFVKIDYTSHKEALLQRVRSRWPQVWNDFLFNGQNSFAMLLIDLMAWSMATMAFLINRQAGENFIPTMTLRESAQRIGALVGYQLRRPIPASVLCEATLPAVAVSDVVLKAGTIVRSSDSNNVPFEVSKNYTIVAGNLTPVLPIIKLSATLNSPGVLNTNVTVANGSPYVNLIDTTQDLLEHGVDVGQSFKLTSPPVAAIFKVISISSSNASGVNNQLIIDPAFDDGTGSAVPIIAEAEIYEPRVSLSQGQTVTDKFIAPTVDTPSFVIKLTQDNVIGGSVGVAINGESWTAVQSLYSATADDTVFLVKTLTTGAVIVQFGDGVFGQIVPPESVVVATYRIGGGIVGNVQRGAINTSVSGFVSGSSNPTTILISNQTANGVGGAEAESVEEARVNIPYFAKTNDRAVTLDDYQTLAQNYSSPLYGSVAYARSSVRTENALLEGNIVIIHAWAHGTGDELVPLSTTLKSALRDYLQDKAVGTDFVMVADGTERPAPISLRFKAVEGHDLDETQGLILGVMRKLIAALRPGSPIIYSNLVRLIDETYGVDSVDMATPIADLLASNPLELFTTPQDAHVYKIDRAAVSSAYSEEDGAIIGIYTAQLPVAPVSPWSMRVFVGSFELTVMPDTTPGYARLYRAGVLSVSSSFKSTVNLLNGRATLALKGAQGDVSMQLITIHGYSRERSVNLYVGYLGVTSQAKRREIRAAIRDWGRGLDVGGVLYGAEISGVITSKSNVKAVVEAVPGVTSVTRVALETPTGSDVKIEAGLEELLIVGLVVINGSND
jgi:hypothetical protein